MAFDVKIIFHFVWIGPSSKNCALCMLKQNASWMYERDKRHYNKSTNKWSLFDAIHIWFIFYVWTLCAMYCISFRGSFSYLTEKNLLNNLLDWCKRLPDHYLSKFFPVKQKKNLGLVYSMSLVRFWSSFSFAQSF